MSHSHPSIPHHRRTHSAHDPSTTSPFSGIFSSALDPASPLGSRHARNLSIELDVLVGSPSVSTTSPHIEFSSRPRPRSAALGKGSRGTKRKAPAWLWLLAIQLLASTLFIFSYMLLRHYDVFQHLETHHQLLTQHDANHPGHIIGKILRPGVHPSSSNKDSLANKEPQSDPIAWLRTHAGKPPPPPPSKRSMFDRSPKRPRAAIISLVRNEELEGILQSMRELEYQFNRHYEYPWMFFSEKEFSEEFKAATSNATRANTSYHLVPRSHWSIPEWVDKEAYMDSLDYLGAIGVGKGWMHSYRQMCRWNSGFFYKHPALEHFDWYWRVEPDVHFPCKIAYDPFSFMSANKLTYGFNMLLLDDARSFASLWRTTQSFIHAHPNLVHPDADLSWLLDPDAGFEYNNCQYFSNFEIGDLNFFRDVPNEVYFDYLDKHGGSLESFSSPPRRPPSNSQDRTDKNASTTSSAGTLDEDYGNSDGDGDNDSKGGGFHLTRYGDAPLHTLSLSLFLPRRDRIWYFHDIGYQHDIATHCPLSGVLDGRCACEPDAAGMQQNLYKLVPMESRQRKPGEACLRLWAGAGGAGGMGGTVRTAWDDDNEKKEEEAKGDEGDIDVNLEQKPATGEEEMGWDKWIMKKEGWNRETEIVFGGDGYGGYLYDFDT